MSSVKARYRWNRFRVSLWFIPLVMSCIAIPLAWAMYFIDLKIPNEMLESSFLILDGSSDVLRSNLISIAGTILTTAGVVFTLLTLPLSTVASQYGSRLLHIFMRDRTTQFVLGMFTATFVYCLTAALTIQPEEIDLEGPQITATVGMLLMVATFSSLILLIQHFSTILQAPQIAASAGTELRDVLNRYYPSQAGRNTVEQASQNSDPELPDGEGYPVRVRRSGYIQIVDPEIVPKLAIKNDLLIRLLHKPGNFVRQGEVVALVWPAERMDEKLAERICHAYWLGNLRTPAQDVIYAFNQLVEMAVRAMSAAINDPFTAMTCLDYIGEGLALLIQRGVKNFNIYDSKGQPRVIFEQVTFDELINISFDMVRCCSRGNATVLQHMLEVIKNISQETESPDIHRKLIRQVNLILSESQFGDLIEHDRQLIQQSAEALVKKLSGTGSHS